MVKKITKTKRSRTKQYPYIVVDGVPNKYLDAALVSSLKNDILFHALKDEPKIMKKAQLSFIDLNKQRFSKIELVEKISPYLMESYKFYNTLANLWNENIPQILAELENRGFTLESSLQEWKGAFDEEIKSGGLSLYTAINTLRFYKSGEYKELITVILEENPEKFYDETGMKLEEGFDLKIDWDTIENQKEDMGMEELEEYLSILKEDKEPSAKMSLAVAMKLIKGVSLNVANFDEVEDLKNKYETEISKGEVLTKNVSELTVQLKAKDNQNEKISKELKTLTKNLDKTNTNLEKHKKDHGKIGHQLGEVRKEKEEIEKAYKVLQRKINTFENESKLIRDKIEKELRIQYDSLFVQKSMENEAELKQLQHEIHDLKSILKLEKEKTLNSCTELENIQKILVTTKDDLKIVESERNELVKQMQNQPAVKSETVIDEDDVLFGFNGEEIEDFVEIDNKPTRN